MARRGRRRIRKFQNPDYISTGMDVSDALKGLKRLGDAVYRTALKAGRQAAVRVVLKEAKTNTHIAGNKTGNLRKGLKVKNRRTQSLFESHAQHSYLVERGHGGPHPAPAHPFLETAVLGTKDRQLRAAAIAIDKATKRAQIARNP